MPAHRLPRWTAEELAVLREHYPAHGVEAVRARLPHRSWQSIYVKANKLGIHSLWRGKGNSPAPRLTGDNLEEAIRLREEQGWSFERIGVHFGVAEASACNAVMIALCTRRGFTPAQRNARGCLTPEGLDRVRYALKKGLKGIDIQLRLGVSAACVAEQRRRYNRELAERGKALLPPPGGGERYSGVPVTNEQRKAVEVLFMAGLGTMKVAQRTGVSKTSCTRIRTRLVRRLKRKGECLPGCDAQGVRHHQAESTRHVHPTQVEACRRLLLDRVPVRRAAALTALGACTAYRLRDELRAELAAQGRQLPTPLFPGRRPRAAPDPFWPPHGPADLYAFRALLAEMPFEPAKAKWRADRRRERDEARAAEAARPKAFEDQLARVAAGAGLTRALTRAHLEPQFTPEGRQ
jgi:hypothetical protein